MAGEGRLWRRIGVTIDRRNAQQGGEEMAITHNGSLICATIFDRWFNYPNGKMDLIPSIHYRGNYD
jgi:hypothetical protein